jgi:hypothetical protein
MKLNCLWEGRVFYDLSSVAVVVQPAKLAAKYGFDELIELERQQSVGVWQRFHCTRCGSNLLPRLGRATQLNVLLSASHFKHLEMPPKVGKRACAAHSLVHETVRERGYT